MTENTINVEMAGYTNAADLSMQCLGVLPQSINGHSPTALIKVVYPNEDYEEIFMDLVTRQNHVSHGYNLKLNNVNIATTYIPWRKMFAGSAVLTVEKEEAIIEEIKEESFKTDPPMSPIYLTPDGKLVLSDGTPYKPQTLQPEQSEALANLTSSDTPKNLNLSNGSLSNAGLLSNNTNGNNISGILLFALGVVAAIGVLSILKR